MEKRAHDRFELWFPVTVDGSTGQVLAVCHDASAGGIFISGSATLSVGDEVTVRFRVNPEDPKDRTARGRIVRVEREVTDPRAVMPYRMAIEFAEAIPALEAHFRRASSRPPPPLTP